MIKQNKFKDKLYHASKKLFFQLTFIFFILIVTDVNSMIAIKNTNNTSLRLKKANNIIITVKGRVTDEEGTPLEGVMVLLKERAKIVKTNSNGDYLIAGMINENLEFSYFGFKNKTFKISKEILNVKLKKNNIKSLL